MMNESAAGVSGQPLNKDTRLLLEEYVSLLISFNRSINLISKQTEPAAWNRHIEHCLTLTRYGFPAGSIIVDWGTGGGLPAIPLAITFPDVRIVAVDSVGKKVHAVRAMARKLGLDNLDVWQGRAESWTGSAHYSVSRATASMTELWTWHRRIVEPIEHVPDSCWKPGLICLKGGDLSEELQHLSKTHPETGTEIYTISAEEPTDVAEAKYIIHIRHIS